MSYRAISVLALMTVLTVPGAAHGDEIRLKDGSKITGTIVGFENGSFRVETSYGFALIQKEKVADINITAPKKEPEQKDPSKDPSKERTVAPVASPPAPPKDSLAAAKPVPPVNVRPTAPVGNAASPAPGAVKDQPASLKIAIATAPPPTPEPPVIHDEIRGNLYVNHTFGFEMYKPPSWNLIPAARQSLPNAVAALGTIDEATLLVIGREPAKDPLETYAAATQKALSEAYENYRLISTRQLTIAALPAIERRSRGSADGHDWSVILLTIVRGSDVFTMMGMTWTDSDLIQVQENIIAKTMNSLAFSHP